MNVTTSLENMGLLLGLSSDGNLILDGLNQLTDEQRGYALSLAKEHKAAILSDLRVRLLEGDAHNDPAVKHARRMMVECPATPGMKWHCWYCSRCKDAPSCTAWRHLRAYVEFYRHSEQPFSLILEEMQRQHEVLQ